MSTPAYPPVRRGVHGSLLLTVVTFAALAGQLNAAEEIPAPSPQASAEISSLIIQLGDESFERREAAVEKLLTFGLPALKQVEEGAKHSDPEISYRCGTLRVALREIDLQRRLEAFTADVKGEKDHGLPAWDRFAQLHGGGAESRRLFVEIFKAEPNLVKTLQVEPKKATDLLAARVLQIQQALQAQKQPSLGSVAALLFSVVEKEVSSTVQTQQLIYNLCHQPSVREALASGPKRDVVRSLLAKYILRGEGWAAHQGLNLALQYDLPEGLELARKLISTKGGGQPHLLQVALLATAKMGTPADVAGMEALLDDKTVIFTSRVNKVNVQCQVRDLALVSVLHLLTRDKEKLKGTPLENGDLKAFGFDRLEGNPTQLYSPHTIGFVNDEARQKVFARWKETKAALSKK